MLRTQEVVISEVREASKRCDTKIDHFIESAQEFHDSVGTSLWDVGDVPGQSYGLSELLLEAQRVVRSIKSLHWARAGLVTATGASNVKTSLQALEATIDQLTSGLASANADSRPLKINPGPIIIHVAGGEQLFNGASLANNLNVQTEALKGTLPSFLLFPRLDRDVEDRETGLFAAKLAAITKLNEDAASAADSITNTRDKASELYNELNNESESFKKNSADLRERLAATITEAESAKASINAIKSEAEAALTNANASERSLAELLDLAREKHAHLQSFHSDLREIATRLSDTETAADNAFAKQSMYISDVETLIAKAESMVSGATVAGLAKAFADERSSLEQGMKSALVSFILGIASIFAVTLLLAAYVFEIPFDIGGIQLSGPGETADLGDEITIAGVLSRAIILLAPFWLTLFSARRYRNLFDLRQQYSHKYNMAFSVDGFRQQAPAYQEQIAAWVFHVVAESPVATKSRRGGMDANPLPSLRDIVEMPGNRFSELLNAATKKP